MNFGGAWMFICSSAIILSSCANGICHPIKHPELAATAGARTSANTNMCASAAGASAAGDSAAANCANAVAKSDVTSTAADMTQQSQTGTNPTGSFGPGVTNNSTNNNSFGNSRVAGIAALKTINVFKPDGSLQCNAGQSIPAEEMEKQLSGIRVLSRKRQNDGKMHMQLCGAATGFLNVYEIPETSLTDALGRGFKKLP